MSRLAASMMGKPRDGAQPSPYRCFYNCAIFVLLLLLVAISVGMVLLLRGTVFAPPPTDEQLFGYDEALDNDGVRPYEPIIWMYNDDHLYTDPDELPKPAENGTR